MNTDLNVATRRLLQVVLDMLTNPDFEQLMKERAQAIVAGEKVYGRPPRYRTDLLAVEAAHRAANEAQQMLFEAMPPAVL